MDPLMLALLVARTEPPQTVAIPQPTKPAKICREGEQVTGSHVRSGRRCLTPEEWDREDSRRDRRPLTMQVTGEQRDGAAPATRPQ